MGGPHILCDSFAWRLLTINQRPSLASHFNWISVNIDQGSYVLRRLRPPWGIRYLPVIVAAGIRPLFAQGLAILMYIDKSKFTRTQTLAAIVTASNQCGILLYQCMTLWDPYMLSKPPNVSLEE
ncbi:hypothetical protein VNO77_15921 [Canavalia gladiata]|uniref:Uncharacterized protein n=1 Tax=Canavalia gladiata TaxID=3824 RepID=A0AAN9QRI5_CANGL